MSGPMDFARRAARRLLMTRRTEIAEELARALPAALERALPEALASAMPAVLEMSFPRVVTMRTFVPTGCYFEITNPVEASRVLDYGAEKDFTTAILADLQPDETLFDIGSCVGLI